LSKFFREFDAESLPFHKLRFKSSLQSTGEKGTGDNFLSDYLMPNHANNKQKL